VSGENFLPTEKLHFLPNPLLSFVASSSFSIGPLKEWVVRAWAGPLDSTSEGAFGSWGLHQGSHAAE